MNENNIMNQNNPIHKAENNSFIHCRTLGVIMLAKACNNLIWDEQQKAAIIQLIHQVIAKNQCAMLIVESLLGDETPQVLETIKARANQIIQTQLKN